jgi:hypothetical protein
MHDAFGRLLVDPDRLPYRERVDAVRRLAGELLADPERTRQWLGRCLQRWLAEGGDLAAVLGLCAQRGSRVTPQSIVRAERAPPDAALGCRAGQRPPRRPRTAR